jgi:hypothetical protein
MVRRIYEEKIMTRRQTTKLGHEDQYVAEVDVKLIVADEDWSPYLSLDDAHKLDDVREALRRGDIAAASKLGRVYRLTRVTT